MPPPSDFLFGTKTDFVFCEKSQLFLIFDVDVKTNFVKKHQYFLRVIFFRYSLQKWACIFSNNAAREFRNLQDICIVLRRILYVWSTLTKPTTTSRYCLKRTEKFQKYHKIMTYFLRLGLFKTLLKWYNTIDFEYQ